MMGAAIGKVAVVNSTTPLTSCADASIIDKVGYGVSSQACFEGAAAPGLSNTTAALRASNGCTDTDVNSVDFSAGPPNPRNSSTAVNVCPAGTPTPTPSPPTATTNLASNVTNLSATLNASVNPNGANTTVHFEYGLDTTYGSTTANQIFGGSADQAVLATVGGLTPSTMYHYRIVAVNSVGTTNGADVAFVTAAPPNPFTGCDLVVYRVGDGSAVLTASAAPVFLDEYTPGGVLVQSIAMPISVSGANNRLTASGNVTSEGLLTESADGAFLIVPGYDANIGDSVPGTTARVVARVNASAVFNTTTALTDLSGNVRSATSTNGTDLWVDGSSGGIHYATLGSGTSTQLSTTVVNLRATNIFGGQLYVTSMSGAFRLATVGTGAPTTTGQTITELPGIDNTNLTSPYGFFFADLDANTPGEDTVYVADDNTTTGGILKFSLVSGSWVSNGTITAAGVRGLTGTVSGTTVTLYATSATDLFTFTDPTGYNGSVTSTTATSITTAGTNTAFRGVAFAPVQCAGGTPTPTPTPSATPSPTTTPKPMPCSRLWHRRRLRSQPALPLI